LLQCRKGTANLLVKYLMSVQRELKLGTRMLQIKPHSWNLHNQSRVPHLLKMLLKGELRRQIHMNINTSPWYLDLQVLSVED